MFDARAGVCGLMDGHYNYTNHGNRLSMQIKTSYHNKVCNLEYNKQNNRELYICTTNVLIILINFSLSLFLHCSYFLAISEPTCSYKVCFYKKRVYVCILLCPSVSPSEGYLVCHSPRNVRDYLEIFLKTIGFLAKVYEISV